MRIAAECLLFALNGAMSEAVDSTFDDDGGFRVRLHTCVREKDLCYPYSKPLV